MKCRQVAVAAHVGGDEAVCISIPPVSFWTRVVGVALSSQGNFWKKSLRQTSEYSRDPKTEHLKTGNI